MSEDVLRKFMERGQRAQTAVDVVLAKHQGIELRCIECGLTPLELPEYRAAAAENECTPDEFVWREEGTLNRANGHFVCTQCYVDMGMPVNIDGSRWVAP